MRPLDTANVKLLLTYTIILLCLIKSIHYAHCAPIFKVAYFSESCNQQIDESEQALLTI